MPRVRSETKHFQAELRLREWINTLTPGDVLPVVCDLTERFNSSHGTIIRALTALADEGLIVRPLGKKRYLIAERFERISARICILRPDYPSHDLYSMERSIYKAGQKRNWTFMPHCFRNISDLDLSRIMAKADALVFIPTAEIISRELIQGLLKPTRPVVVLLQHLKHPMINNVCIDDFRAGELAVETLYNHGHRRILFLKAEPDETTMRERFRGFRSAAERLKIPAGNELYLATHLKAFEDSMEATYLALSARLDKGKPDFSAIFAPSFSGVLAAYRALREHDLRVPEDIAVLAYSGESNLAPYLTPPPTSLEINTEEFGEYTAILLENALSGNREKARQLTLTPKLVIRGSI